MGSKLLPFVFSVCRAPPIGKPVMWTQKELVIYGFITDQKYILGFENRHSVGALLAVAKHHEELSE